MKTISDARDLMPIAQELDQHMQQKAHDLELEGDFSITFRLKRSGDQVINDIDLSIKSK